MGTMMEILTKAKLKQLMSFQSFQSFKSQFVLNSISKLCSMRDHKIPYGIILISSALQDDSHHFFLRTGSMYGNKIEYAKEAISYFVRFLQPGSYFNIISYGSTVLPLFRYCTFMSVLQMISDQELD